MKKVISVLMGAILLSGCSISNKNLDCPLGKGMQCSSISKVNQAVNEGKLAEVNSNKPQQAEVPQLSFQQASEDNLRKKLPPKVTRLPEKILRIWLSGFTDENGDYVEETYAHIVAEPGKWHEGK